MKLPHRWQTHPIGEGVLILLAFSREMRDCMLDFLTLDLGLGGLFIRELVEEREVVPDRVSLEGGCVILASVRSVLQASQQRYVEGFTRVQISQVQLV